MRITRDYSIQQQRLWRNNKRIGFFLATTMFVADAYSTFRCNAPNSAAPFSASTLHRSSSKRWHNRNSRTKVRMRSASSNSATAIQEQKKQSIGIVGSGAVGSYYGARLWECADLYDVKFQIRSQEHYDACTSDGLRVKSIDGDIFIPPESLQAYQSTHEMGQVDWIVLALKSTALQHVPSLIEPLLHDNTRILAIMNGLIDEDLVEMLCNMKSDVNDDFSLPCKCVYGGMAFICSNRVKPGFVDHSFGGSLSGGISAITKGNSLSTALGSTKDEEKEELNALEHLWQPTKVEFVKESSLIRGRWTKNCLNLPFSSVCVALQGIMTIEDIVKDPILRKLADDIMDETIALANADLINRGVDSTLLLGETEKQRCWEYSDNMGRYKPSTMIDFAARRPMEVHYLFRKPLERAKELGVSVPKYESIVEQIEGLQRFYSLY